MVLCQSERRREGLVHKKKMRVRRSHSSVVFLVLAILLLLAGCASAPVEEGSAALREARRLERSVTPARIRQAPVPALEDLGRALHLFSLLDAQEGQVRCHLLAARIQSSLARPDVARGHLANALAVAERLGEARYLYQVHLMLGRIDDEQEEYRKALGLADTPIERAVALTYLGRTGEAYRAITGVLEQADTAPEDYAFVLYRHARATGNLDVAGEALGLYKQADDFPGVADNLFLMARLHRAGGRTRESEDYLLRALTVARALGDPVRIQAMERELGEVARLSNP